jgi:hypothetical protein
MAIPTITPLPEAPVRGDTEATFTTKANAFVAALPTLVTEINTVGDEMELTLTACQLAETNAETAESNAELAQGLAEGAQAAAEYAQAQAEAAAGSMTPESDTILMSSTPITDAGTVQWTFVIKTLNGIGTYTLRATPAAHTTYEFKNDGTGNLTINGNGKNIDGSATYTLSSEASVWIRYNGTDWSIIDVTIGDAPIDGSEYVRKDGSWIESTPVASGITTELSTSTTLVVGSVNAVVATGNLTFIVPTGTTGDSITVIRNGFGGYNVFTGAFANSQTSTIISDNSYSLKLSWLASGSYWIVT